MFRFMLIQRRPLSALLELDSTYESAYILRAPVLLDGPELVHAITAVTEKCLCLNRRHNQ
jgi:hypothetical protein